MAELTKPRSRVSIAMGWLGALAFVACGLAAVASYQRWVPVVQTWIAARSGAPAEHGQEPAGEHEKHEHAGHDHAGHDHAGHDDATSIELTAQARKNIGLRTMKVELGQFTRTITVPGIIVERPGRSVFEVTAPLTGVVTRIFPIQGEAIRPGQKLFEVRLTHEEVVQAQADMLRTVEELAVTAQEIERLTKVTAAGVIAGKTLLDRKYEQQKQQGALRAQKQALLLHGLSEQQIDEIEQNRKLLQTLTAYAPQQPDETPGKEAVFQLDEVRVALGQHVNAGDILGRLTDHAELYIEGNAFERDASEVNQAAESGLPIAAALEAESTSQRADDLHILYVASKVDPETRTLHFYVPLPNTIVRDRVDGGHRFMTWRFRPGQRMQLQVPVETLEGRIVLPAQAVAQDGVESYVFTANGDHFDRRPVHVEYRDPTQVVIANDGAIFPGDVVAISAAQQLQLALKNKSGGGIDPHAGHNH
jgi:multidrug efflux pump subunit AcrA (membrane-fusion protein)